MTTPDIFLSTNCEDQAVAKHPLAKPKVIA